MMEKTAAKDFTFDSFGLWLESFEICQLKLGEFG